MSEKLRSKQSPTMTRRHAIGAGTALIASMAAPAAGHPSEGRMAMNRQATPAGEQTPREVIEAYYGAYAQGDIELLRPFLAPDIVWRIPGEHPLAGDKHGVAEVLAFFAQLGKAGFQAETVVLAEADDWVIDLHRGFSTMGEGELDILWALAFRVVDAQIVEAINFAFDQALANSFFWRNFPLKPIPERLLEA